MFFPLQYTGVLNWPIDTPSKAQNNLGAQPHLSNSNHYLTDLTGLKILVTSNIQTTANYVSCLYTLHLFPLLLITLTGFLLGGLLYYTHQPTWALIALIMSVIYFASNFIYLHQKTHQYLNPLADAASADTLWQQQQTWLNNNSVCPACGEPENPYSEFCVNCGLRLSHKKQQRTSTSTTSHQSHFYSIKPHAKNRR